MNHASNTTLNILRNRKIYTPSPKSKIFHKLFDKDLINFALKCKNREIHHSTNWHRSQFINFFETSSASCQHLKRCFFGKNDEKSKNEWYPLNCTDALGKLSCIVVRRAIEKMLWVDYKRINLDGPDRRQNYLQDKRINKKGLSTRHSGSASVTVLEYFLCMVVEKLCFISSTHDSRRYCICFEEQLLSSLYYYHRTQSSSIQKMHNKALRHTASIKRSRVEYKQYNCSELAPLIT